METKIVLLTQDGENTVPYITPKDRYHPKLKLHTLYKGNEKKREEVQKMGSYFCCEIYDMANKSRI